ncbi:MAG: hypothetical protein R8G66_17740 [Cytophagales bacterium]|nr:hypothetical protein [Cytophagales bacterium]
MDLKETLTLFITRMAMYIHPINKETIVAFIHGYEVGLGHQTFTEVLSNHLETEFRIKKIALGWPSLCQ